MLLEINWKIGTKILNYTQEWMQSTNNCMILNTSSDEAAKLYDAAVSQLVGWYQDASLGGLQGTLERMHAADPEFLLGQALTLEINLIGGLTAPRLNPSIGDKVAKFNELLKSKRSKASEQELMHAEVVNHLARSELREATRVYERLNTLYPGDLASLKMVQDGYFFLGTALPMRNSIANAVPRLNMKKDPLAGYAHGMFAFALEESNMYPQAKEQALKALEFIPRDTWAIHNYAHCLEMLGETKEGLDWMLSKQPDWAPCATLASHQYWHTALFRINNNEFDEAVHLLDTEILSRCTSSGSTIDLHDSCSMIYRMELVDLFSRTNTSDSGGRWSKVYDVCKSHKQDHLIGFNDAHYMMSFLGQGDLEMARGLIATIDDVPNFNEGQTVVKPLLEAMLEYKLGNYTKCVDLLEPIRFDIIRVGGSHAQRDVFEQLLVVAALKSDKSEHHRLAERMLTEREVFHGRKTVQTQLLAGAGPGSKH